MTFFQGIELDYLETAYTDNYLQKMAHYYINGIWLYILMRDLISTEIFPQLGNNSRKYAKLIKSLCKRAAKYGIKVFIYCQEPMAVHETDHSGITIRISEAILMRPKTAMQCAQALKK